MRLQMETEILNFTAQFIQSATNISKLHLLFNISFMIYLFQRKINAFVKCTIFSYENKLQRRNSHYYEFLI